MAVTDRGKVWEITNSIFVVFTFFLGFANWVAFLYCSWLVKCKKWRYYALLYASPLILTIIIGKFTDLTFYGVIISGIISIVHIFKIREEVLVRYDRLIKYSYLAEADIDKLINKTRIDCGNTPTEKESFYAENESITLTQESESIISNNEDISKNKESNIKDKKETSTALNINTASESELASLPGIGLILAKKAINHRETKGYFNSIDEFAEILSLKPHILERIKPLVIVNKFESEYKADELSSKIGRIVDF